MKKSKSRKKMKKNLTKTKKSKVTKYQIKTFVFDMLKTKKPEEIEKERRLLLARSCAAETRRIKTWNKELGRYFGE